MIGEEMGSYFCEELIFKILSFTSVAMLLRCRSVCKLWLSIISEPEFIKAYHTNSQKSPSILMISLKYGGGDDDDDDDEGGGYGRRVATIMYPNSPEEDSIIAPLIPPFDFKMDIVSTFYGIVCVVSSAGDIFLLNLLTRMSKKLPPTTTFENIDVAFGFDCVCNDFKVLRIGYQRAANTTSTLVDVVLVHLYSLKSDSWREIEVGVALPSLLCYPISPILRSGPVVRGVLHLEGINTIVTFDLHTEMFGLIQYPSFVHTRKSNILDFEGSVALVLETVRDGSIDDKEVSLWTLEADSDKVFWNKMFTFEAGLKEIDWVFLYAGAHKFVGKTRSGTILCDYTRKEIKYIRLPSQSFLVKVLKFS